MPHMPHASSSSATGYVVRNTRDVAIESAARALLDALDRQHGHRVRMSLNVIEARGALRDLLPRPDPVSDPADRVE
jgi:hypothetical protein